METAYLHLITNHIPIIGVPFALAVLIVGIWRNSFEIKALSFLIFVFLGAATVGVYFLGQGGEDFVEELAGVSHDAIEAHEDVAKLALAATLILGAISLFALIRYRGFSILMPAFRPNSRKEEPVVEDVGDGTEKSARETKPPVFPHWISLTILVLAVVTTGVLGYTGRMGGKIRHTEFHGGPAQANDNENEKKEVEDADAGGNEREEGGGKGRGRNRGKN